MTEADDLVLWARCGAMALTGAADGPPSAAPAGLARAAAAAAADVASMTGRLGSTVEIDGPALLAERAAIAGLGRRGSVSVGGAARFERSADGWVVLNLPRAHDVAALPALLETDLDPDDWTAVAAALAGRSSADLVDRGRLLGLAIARPDERPQPAAPARELVRGSARAGAARPLVLDLTSLWAGPLAGSLLAQAGARVIKIEGRGRVDGARNGASAFFDLLNAGKEMLALDFDDRDDVALLRRLVAAADLVLEGSRPRAMEHLGLDPFVVVDRDATSWLSITGHGRVDEPDRVGFGDDAAVAGGLWLADAGGPMFVADAVADPLTGMVAAALAAEMLVADRAAVIETPLSRVAAWARARPIESHPLATADGWNVMIDGEAVSVAEPTARVARLRAAPVDAHGSSLRSEFAER